MEMSQTFKIAVSLMQFNKEQAIREFEYDLIDNPTNISALHNIALCKIKLAKEAKDKNILKESIAYLQKAVDIMDREKYNPRPNQIDESLKMAQNITI